MSNTKPAIGAVFYLKDWVEAVNADGRFGRWAWDVSFRTSDIKDKIVKHAKV